MTEDKYPIYCPLTGRLAFEGTADQIEALNRAVPTAGFFRAENPGNDTALPPADNVVILADHQKLEI